MMPEWVQYVRRHLDLPELTRAREDEIVEDLARQLEDFYREGVSRGLSLAEAEEFARKQIPDWESLKSDIYRMERRSAKSKTERWAESATVINRGKPTMFSTLFTGLRQDILFGVRMLARNPGFTLAAVLTLALGIGANSTIFSWMNTILLNPFPGVSVSDELFVLAKATPRGTFSSLSYPDYVDYRERSTTVAGLIVYEDRSANLTRDGQAERVWLEMVSYNYFDVLGVQPQQGRGFLPEDEELPGQAVTMLSHAFWQERFGGDTGIVGESLTLNGEAFTVIGIASPGFQGTTVGLSMDLWVPVTQQPALTGSSRLDARGSSWMNTLVRLRPDYSRQQVEAELSNISQALEEEYPNDHQHYPALLFPLWKSPEGAASMLGPVLAVLMGIVGLMLLIACANVANLLLARSATRRKEIAIRLAHGASPFRLVRQLLTESLLLSLLGGALGIAMTVWTSRLLLFFVPPTDAPVDPKLGVDSQVFLFTLAVSVLTGLLFGLAPAWQATRTDLLGTLNEESARSSGGRSKGWLRSALVVSQVSLSLVLLVSAGLFIRSLQAAQDFDPGYNTRDVLLTSMDLFQGGYDPTTGRVFLRDALEELRALPGVESAAFSNRVPLSTGGRSSTSIVIEGYEKAEDEDVFANYIHISADYFHTIETPLLEGREFTASDIKDEPGVVMVNQTMAARYWKDSSPLGQRIRVGENWLTVVGVVPDTAYFGLNDKPTPFMYLALQQWYRSTVTAYLRTAGEPTMLAGPVRETFRKINPSQPVYRVMSFHTATGFATFQQKLVGNLLGVFGLLALLLTSIGLYGVVAYSVNERTHEIGIRMALGAQPGAILGLVVKQSFVLLSIGLVLGLAGAFAATRAMGSLLYEVSPSDPITYAITAIVLIVVSLVASLAPARRATRVEPMVALRYE
jgi:predicted permease